MLERMWTESREKNGNEYDVVTHSVSPDQSSKGNWEKRGWIFLKFKCLTEESRSQAVLQWG